MNNSNNTFLTVVELIERALQLYMDYIARAKIGKFKILGESLISVVVAVLLIFLLATSVWLVALSATFVFLQFVGLTIVANFAVLIGINLGLLLIAVLFFRCVKGKLLNLLNN